MELTINQSIYIHFLKVGSVSNSSVLQIGSTGQLHALSQLYNTGGFAKTAEDVGLESSVEPLVPLASPS
ncbi:spore germination protein GerPB [Gracilibacillus marinus]|jgi:spore germination protein PB|uniref:Spore germination protein GerPB n=1 Tax=Gracilibacillus marinus TaxID=630535 RepID=A0ABV8VQT3_9BACI